MHFARGRGLSCRSCGRLQKLPLPAAQGHLIGYPWCMSKIAFIGTGAMGSRMAARLIAAGHELILWNRTRARIESLLAMGAKEASTPAQAAWQADVVITMVADEKALLSVAEGPEGIAKGLRPSTTLLEMSTSGPHAVDVLRGLLPAGVLLLDAPVLGSLAEAEEGTLAIFVGGPSDVFTRLEPLLSVLGTPIHVGPLGAGARAKLVANASLIGVLGLLGEVLALADGLLLPRDTAFTVLSHTPLAAQATRRRPAVESGDYPLRFHLSLACKDAGLITSQAEESGLDLRLLPAAASWLQQAAECGRGAQDYSGVLAEILRQGGEGDR